MIPDNLELGLVNDNLELQTTNLAIGLKDNIHRQNHDFGLSEMHFTTWLC